MILYYDLETRSKTDLKSSGAWRYGEDKSADIICMAYAVDNNPVKIWLPGQAVPDEFLIADCFIARNVFFEYSLTVNVLIKVYGFPRRMGDTSAYICTAALSRMHGLPASLEASAEYLNKRFKKLPNGMKLISLYCIPRRDGTFKDIPSYDMKAMIEYNRIDVESDREAFQTLQKLPNWEVEKPYYYHDFALNVKGIRIDVEALNRLILVFDEATNDINNRQSDIVVYMPDPKKVLINPTEARFKTWAKKQGAEVPADKLSNPKFLDAIAVLNIGRVPRDEAPKLRQELNVRSVPKLKAYLLENDIIVEDCKIETIEEAYEEADNRGFDEVKKVLAWRMFCAKASIKKLYAALKRVSPDGRLRYFLKYFGAHTGRYSGEGFQIHNLPKAKWEKGVDPCVEIERLIKEINPSMPYRDLIDYGKKILPGLIIPDEGNVFLAGDFAAVEARGIAWLAGCNTMLQQFAAGTDIYTVMAKRINPHNPNRQLGKAVILGCGYGMGVDKFYETCKKWGIEVSKTMAETAVRTYRDTYSEIPAFWYALEDAFRSCWLTKQPRTVGRLRFERGGNYIRVKLPAGRWMYYHQIKIEDGQLSFANFGKKGARGKLYGGILAENITQAMCRDILCDRMIECEKHGLPVALSVHDEIVSEVRKNIVDKKRIEFDRILNTAPEWAKGFPLSTESKILTRYCK